MRELYGVRLHSRYVSLLVVAIVVGIDPSLKTENSIALRMIIPRNGRGYIGYHVLLYGVMAFQRGGKRNRAAPYWRHSCDQGSSVKSIYFDSTLKNNSKLEL